MRQICLVHVPKAGGSSLLLDLGRALSTTMIAERSPNFVRFRSSTRADLELIYIGHDARDPEYMTLARFKQREPDAFCFAVVRNPYERLLSAFHYLNQGGNRPADQRDAEQYLARFDGDFARFVREALSGPEPLAVFQQIHLRPQVSWLCDERGLVLVDHLGRLESIDATYQALARELGLSLPSPSHLNRRESERPDPYDDELCAIVARAYRDDFARLGYAP